MFETERLRLRELSLGDENILFPHITDDLTKYWIGWEPPADIEEERIEVDKKLGQVTKHSAACFLAFEREHGQFVGFVSYEPNPLSIGETEVALWVVGSEQGKGYASEMLLTLVQQAKKRNEISGLVYSVTEGNERSERIAKRMGFRKIREFIAEKRGRQVKVADYEIVLT